MVHSIILTELNAESDLRAVVGAIANVLNIDMRSAVECAKNLPLTLAENLNEKEALLMANMFGSMGAGIKISPPLDEDIATPLRELKTELPKKDMSLGCLIFIALTLAACIYIVGQKREWLEEQIKPSPVKAEKLLQKGKTTEAGRSIRKQLRKKPDDTELLVLQGRFYIAVAHEKMDKEQWKNYGKAGTSPELDSSVAFFRKAESINPKDGSIPRWISIAEQLRGSFSEAETAARRAISIDAQDVDNWNQLGSVLIDKGNNGLAEQAFYNALKIDTNDAATLKNLAILNLYYQQDADRAAKFLFAFLEQNTAETDSDSFKLRTDLATAMLGDFNPPLDKLSPPKLPFDEYEKRRAEIAANPQLKTDPLLQEQLGLLYMSKGEMESAEDCFIKAIHLSSNIESSRKMLAIMYMKEPNYEKSLKIMHTAADNGSRDPFFWKNIGVLEKYYKANHAGAHKAFGRYFALGGDSYQNKVKKEAGY
jgi:Flp pilus assembly protein TadD